MTTDKAPKSIAAILASADLMLADSREMATETRVLLADARALSAEFDVVLDEQAKLKARLLEPRPPAATLDQPWDGGPVALDEPARARVAAIAGALIASASPVELDQLAATLEAIRKARAE